AQRVDTHMIFFANRLSTKAKPENTMMRVNWNQFGRYRFDGRGRLQEGLAGTGLNFVLRGNAYAGFETGFMMEKIYEDEFGAERDPFIGRTGAFVGSPQRTAIQPYFSSNIE